MSATISLKAQTVEARLGGGIVAVQPRGKLETTWGEIKRPWARANIGQVFQTVWEYTPEGWTPFAVSPQDKLATMWGEIKRGRPVD